MRQKLPLQPPQNNFAKRGSPGASRKVGKKGKPANRAISVVPRMADEADPGNVLAVKNIGSGRLIALTHRQDYVTIWKY